MKTAAAQFVITSKLKNDDKKMTQIFVILTAKKVLCSLDFHKILKICAPKQIYMKKLAAGYVFKK